MPRIALLSNPRSTGNKCLLPKVRAFCAEHKDIFHYEVEDVHQIGDALKTIALVKPAVLVINGGDGTVQATLTELHHGGHFGGNVPPVAVLPNGKTNLIAIDLGASGDPIGALSRVLELVRNGMAEHVVTRELIELSDGADGGRPVLGMFLGGAALAETILFCRHKLYPLGLPNGVAHAMAMILGLLSILVGRRASFLPLRPKNMKISVLRQGVLQGQFAFLVVTTLQRLLLKIHMPASGQRMGAMQMLVIDRSVWSLITAFTAAVRGKLGRMSLRGVHLERGDEIHIEGDRSSVLLDGELFETRADRPIILRPTPPVPFLRLAV